MQLGISPASVAFRPAGPPGYLGPGVSTKSLGSQGGGDGCFREGVMCASHHRLSHFHDQWCVWSGDYICQVRGLAALLLAGGDYYFSIRAPFQMTFFFNPDIAYHSASYSCNLPGSLSQLGGSTWPAHGYLSFPHPMIPWSSSLCYRTTRHRCTWVKRSEGSV